MASSPRQRDGFRRDLRAIDIDGDGRDEFLFAAGTTLYAVNGRADSGQILWQTQLPSEPGNLALADVDADANTEILFIGGDSVLCCLDIA